MDDLWINNFGALYSGENPVGYYDDDLKKCYLNDGTVIKCPENNPSLAIPEIKSTRTYWWVLVVVAIVLILFFAWFINRKK